MNNLMKALAGGFLGGVVGAVVWMLIACFTGYEVGIVAWLVGFLAGLGVMIGTRGSGGTRYGLLAAGIAVVCILGGKLGAVSLEIDRFEREELTVTEANVIDYISGEVASEMIDAGKIEDSAWEGLGADEYHPPVVVAEATRRWEAMSSDERGAFMRETTAENKAAAKEYRGIATALFFFLSFGLWGFLWLGLATVSAFKMGSARRDAGQEVQAGVASESFNPEPGEPQGVSALDGINPGVVKGLLTEAATLPAPRSARPRFTMTGEPIDGRDLSADGDGTASREAA
ncbi:MAG: hypothetical protein ACKVZJ_09625 [Phycisphaerales bacterium]